MAGLNSLSTRNQAPSLQQESLSGPRVANPVGAIFNMTQECITALRRLASNMDRGPQYNEAMKLLGSLNDSLKGLETQLGVEGQLPDRNCAEVIRTAQKFVRAHKVT